jgi:hypothetical protein
MQVKNGPIDAVFGGEIGGFHRKAGKYAVFFASIMSLSLSHKYPNSLDNLGYLRKLIEATGTHIRGGWRF